MAKKNGGGVLFSNPRNETSGKGTAADPDISGGGLYGDWSDDVMSMHLSQNGADMLESPNVKEGGGIFGGPAPGEPNPFGFSGTNQST